MFRNASKAFVCRKCDKSFPSPSKRDLHMKHTHNAFLTPDCKKNSEFKTRTSAHHNKNFNCVVCHEKFSEKSLLMMHVNQHIDVASYACEICRDGFQQRKDLQKHLLDIHGRKEILPVTLYGSKVMYQKCCHCSKYFKLFFEFEEHKSECCSGTYICDICYINFSSITSLMSHKSIEHKCELSARGYSALIAGKQYFCGICYLGFFRGNTLKDHIKMHDVKAFYMCEVCHRSFASDSDMQNHYLRHIEEHYALHNVIQQHSCSVCKQTFKTQTHLENHLKSEICSNKATGNNNRSTSLYNKNISKSCFTNFEESPASDDEIMSAEKNAMKSQSNGVFHSEPQLEHPPVYVLKSGDELLNCDDHKCIVVVDKQSVYVLQRGACASDSRLPHFQNTEIYLDDEEIDTSMLDDHMLHILKPTKETGSSGVKESVYPVIHDENNFEQDLNMESDTMETITFEFK